MHNKQTHSAHSILNSSLRCTQPNTALQSSLRKSCNHCKSPDHAGLDKVQHHAIQQHTGSRTAVPIRRSVCSLLKAIHSVCPALVPLQYKSPFPIAQSRTFQFTQISNLRENHTLDRLALSTRFIYTPTTFEIMSKQSSRSPLVKSHSNPHGNPAAVHHDHSSSSYHWTDAGVFRVVAPKPVDVGVAGRSR